MKKTIDPLKISPPAGPGKPAVLDCSTFQGHLDRFEDALLASLAAEFPSVTLQQLGDLARTDSGFERHWAGAVAIGFAAGQRAGRLAAGVEVAQSQARAATAAAAVKVPRFEDLVLEKIKTGATKSQAVSAVVSDNPKAHLEFIQRGGQL